MRSVAKVVGYLYIIQISAGMTIWLSTYFPGIDILLSILYFLVITLELSNNRLEYKKWGLVAVFWQGPWLIVSLISQLRPGSYAFFLLQFWNTPFIPLLSCISFNIKGTPFYYYMLLIMPVILGLYVGIVYKYTKIKSAGCSRTENRIARQR